MTRNQIFIVSVLAGLVSGSGFYFGHTLLKPSQILPLVAIAYLPFEVAKNRLKYDRLALWLALYIVVAGVYNLPNLVKDQLIDYAFIISTFLIYIAAFLSAGLMRKGDKFPAKVLLMLLGGIFALYLCQITIGAGFLPIPVNPESYSATFNNVNDLASFVVVFIPLALYGLQQWKPGQLVTLAVFLALCGWVIILGSRSCILALFLVPLMYAAFAANPIWKLFLLSLSGLTGVLLSQLNWERILDSLAAVDNAVVSRSASRLALFLFDFEDDKSSSYRLDSYTYAIDNIGDALFGLGTKNYESFYQAGFGEETLVAFAPHSYLIENVLAFGWLGLALIVMMLATCLLATLQDKKHLFYGLTTFILFFMVSFVPSTVIRLPILWFPVFFFFHLARQKSINFDWASLAETQRASVSESYEPETNYPEPNYPEPNYPEPNYSETYYR